jgi:transitional endoplasmic reticulum ATPase
MTALTDPARWRPLGNGRSAPAGSVTDTSLASRLAAYKRNVAGTYRSVPPGDIANSIPAGPYVVSEKIDGETWFLHSDATATTLLSPRGRAITGVPLTDEASTLLDGWSGLLAGELYAVQSNTNEDRQPYERPRVFDLHAALGGGADARTDRLRFAAFDILRDGDADPQRDAYAVRTARLQVLLAGSSLVHCASFETVDESAAVAHLFERVVTSGGAEGLVVHGSDGRVFKVKPEIAIDGAVVAYAESEGGVSELLLGLIASDDSGYQLIGRVRTGWSHREKQDLRSRLEPTVCESSYRGVTDHGTLYRWVQPELVVEIKCNDLLAVDTREQPIRRMRLAYSDDHGWTPLGPAPAVSLINAVFLRVRDDKRAQRPDARFEQVSDLVPVAATVVPAAADLPASEIVRREVYTKRVRGGVAVRKLVAWRTNKHELDPRFPAFAALFTDYAPERQQPLKTELRVASTMETLDAFVDDWLASKIKRGWEAVSIARQDDIPEAAAEEPTATIDDNHDEAPQPTGGVDASTPGPRLGIAFARSSSPTFPIVRRRLDALAQLGSLAITHDDKGREAWFELTIDRALVQSARRLANLLNIVRGWKTTEVSLDGELLGKHDLGDFMERLETVRRCWLRRKKQGPASCHASCAIACEALRIRPTHEHLSYAGNTEPPWFTVGRFNGESVIVDKQALRDQVQAPRNAEIRLCPRFDADAVGARIDALPGTIVADDDTWMLVYHSKDGKPAWLWPCASQLPSGLRDTPHSAWQAGGLRIGVDLGRADDSGATTTGHHEQAPAPPARSIPPTRYADVLGQDDALEAVRDLVELPLKHAELFARLGAQPQANGVLLAGSPGTGKTLLARAVAGECGAHVEIVSGPSLLSKWVGESEAAIRTIFERARDLAPSVILFDEIDALAPRRGESCAQHDVSLVAQLLVLLDGLEGRGQVFVLGTTNRPDDIDPALRRPGRFDQVVWMGLPDQEGRAALFMYHMRDLKLDAGIDRESFAAELAAATEGCTGADIAFVCQRAALLCVKAAAHTPDDLDIAITADHLREAVALVTRAPTSVAASRGRRLRTAG